MNSIVKEKRYISEKLGVPYESLSQSYLRAETKVVTGTQIAFTLQRNKATSTIVTERLLDLTDEFVITEFTVGLKGVEVDPDVGFVTDEEHARAFVKTYEGLSLVNVGNAVYNSNMNFTIDRTEFVPQYPTRAFRRVPFQQMTQDTNPTPVVKSFDGFPNGKFGFASSEPTLINGRQTLDLTLDLGQQLVAPTTFEAYVVFEARGYLVTNAV